MKTFTNSLKTMVLALLMMGAIKSQAQCLANYSYAINPNGNVTFISTSFPTNSLTTYYWNFGNTTTYSATGAAGASTSVNYTANGSYVVSLFFITVPTCSNVVQYTVNVTNAVTPTCNINANFGYTQGGNGLVNFNNTSTGTVSGVTYSWFFGDNTTGTQVAPAHTYSANGVYQATLVANNNTTPACSNGITLPVVVNSYCTISANFTYSVNTNGSVSFFNTTTPTLGLNYSWNFGNSTSSSLMNPVAIYTANGTYTVTLTANSSSTCVNQHTAVVTINNSGCGLNANFSTAQTINGGVNFNNTSTGTVSGTSYLWNFGDSSPNSTLVSPAHTYSANGIYLVILTANNNGTFACVSTKTLSLFVNSYCNLVAGFNYTTNNNGNVSFANTSTPSSSLTSYFWNFGGVGSSTVLNPNFTFPANGLYTVVLQASIPNSAQGCTSTAVQTIAINNIITCSLNAAFSHTVGSSGQVNFTNLSAGTNSGTTYSWNFGDGWSSTNTNPSHTYINAGTHYVTLIISNASPAFCVDTAYQAINITGIPCLANSNFTLLPTSTPQYWVAVPSYPWNVTNAVWTWGDNSSSTGLYSSHQYSVSGNYNICLSVTVSCGSTSSSCATYSVFRSAANMINVSVKAPDLKVEITGINKNAADNSSISFFPNPNNGLFNLSVKNLNSPQTNVVVYNMVGQKVFDATYPSEANELNKQLDLSSEPAGIYVVTITNGDMTYTKKIVISH
jgi:PKD repeat protein